MALAGRVVAIDLDQGRVAVVYRQIEVAVTIDVRRRGAAAVQAEGEAGDVADLVEGAVTAVLEEPVRLQRAP